MSAGISSANAAAAIRTSRAAVNQGLQITLIIDFIVSPSLVVLKENLLILPPLLELRLVMCF